MANSINKVTLVGNLGREPEVRHTQSGSKIVNMSIATTDSWKDKQTGERKERTEWHRVVIFNPGLADIAERFVKKGSRVYIEGSLQTRKWQDNSGVEKYTTEIVLQNYNGELVLLDAKGSDGYESSSSSSLPFGNDSSSSNNAGWDEAATSSSDLDDDIPF